MSSTVTARPVGSLLREWRERRRLSQLELSSRAEISTRHLSFVETGRSKPTPQMILKLTDQLDVPLRERNQLLLAGGYAPAYPQHGLDEPALDSVRAALKLVLSGHEPYPALVINRWWELQDANAAVALLVSGCAPHLLEPPVNVLRLSLHPDGMAPRIANLAQWRAHLLERLARRAENDGDERLAALHAELFAYPGGQDRSVRRDDVVVPLRLRHETGELSFFSIAAAVETASDVTVAELMIESFYPADPDTATRLRALVGREGSGAWDEARPAAAAGMGAAGRVLPAGPVDVQDEDGAAGVANRQLHAPHVRQGDEVVEPIAAAQAVGRAADDGQRPVGTDAVQHLGVGEDPPVGIGTADVGSEVDGVCSEHGCTSGAGNALGVGD